MSLNSRSAPAEKGSPIGFWPNPHEKNRCSPGCRFHSSGRHSVEPTYKC